MARDTHHDEARDEMIDELAAKHHAKLRAQLQAGNADLASAIGEAIAPHMTDEICNEQMFYAVMPGGGAASPRYKKLVGNALRDMAEIAAIAEVEQLERQHHQSHHEARLDRVLMDRAMSRAQQL